MKRLVLALMVSGSFMACGNGSGVDGGKSITELNESDVTALCEYLVDIAGGEGHVEDCGDFEYTTWTVEECSADFDSLPEGCSGVTVSELEACHEAISEDVCSQDLPPECAEFIECASGA